MTPPQRILCGCGCDQPMSKPWKLWQILFVPTLAMIAIGLLIFMSGCTPSDATPPAHVHDETLCNAKYANWIIRHDELAKPQPEQWHAFKRHMAECVR